MRPTPLVLSPVLAVLLLAGSARAGDLRITLPKRTKPTPVQKLNQEGIKALKRHKYEEARKLFYRAYVLDPDDPFTLNNLGYISELSGDADRAQRFYELAAENASDATVARATDEAAEGKPISQVAGKTLDRDMLVNRYNVQAIGLLRKDRAPEADLVLQKALAINPRNAFTLNNLGFAKEKEGELDQARVLYSKAANTGSQDPVVISVDKDWRGKAISEVASNNARKLQRMMDRESEESLETRVARFNLAGVSAMNRNDHAAARKYFQQAYRLAPSDSFTLNNMGYLSELDGDRETADFYYAKAAEAEHRNTRVAVATNREIEGKAIGAAANLSDNKILNRMEAERAQRAAQGGPILLKRRDNSMVIEPDKPPAPLPEEARPQPDSENQVMPPLPDNRQPPAAQPSQPSAQPSEPAANPGNVLPPLPDNQQPPAANPGNVLPPLPDSQQPPAAKQPPKNPPPR